MIKRLTQAAVVILLLFVAAQFVRPKRANPPTDPSRAIQAHAGTTSELVAVLDRACIDCHSNRTAWPWYTQVAPLSWLMAIGVKEGRKAVNFSEWAAYSAEQRRQLLVASCRVVSEGKMPGSPYTMLHPEARLSSHDIETICAAARQVEADTAGASR